MNCKRCLIVTEDEVRKGVTALYADILADTVKDILHGDCPIPSVIFEKGIKGLSTKELVEVADVWAELTLMSYNGDNSKNTAVAVLMMSDGENGQTYLLNRDALYEKDFKR